MYTLLAPSCELVSCAGCEDRAVSWIGIIEGFSDLVVASADVAMLG